MGAPNAALNNGKESLNGHHIPREDAQVLIVGAGPCGLMLAYLLAKLQISTLVIERHTTRLGAPKAHALSPRSLEICRQAGLSIPEIRSWGSPRAHARHVRFVSSLVGKELGTLPYERMDTQVLEDTPEILHNIAQPDFETLLAGKLEKEPLCQIRRGKTWMNCEQTRTGVVSTIQDTHDTGTFGEVHSAFVVACDGAKSRVRQSVGIEMSGEDAYETLLTLHFRANLLPVVKSQVGILYWVMDPAARGFVIGYDLGGSKPGNQVLIHNFDASTRNGREFTEEECKHVIRAAIGTDLPFEFMGSAPWVLSRKVADRYRSQNVLLAGDAAHAFPPTGGLGLNTGIADVHNLGLKLASILKGQAASSVLDVYERERRQVALVNAAQSLKNGKAVFSLLREVSTVATEENAARAELLQHLEKPQVQTRLTELIQQQQEHFNNLNLHLGYVYGRTSIPSSASTFEASFSVGGRLPHAWIVPSDEAGMLVPPVDLSYVDDADNNFKQARRYSTLDLVHLNGVAFIGNNSQSHEEIYRIISEAAQAHKVAVRRSTHTADFDFLDSGGAGRELWLDLLHGPAPKALLIRPDQHILAILDGSETRETLYSVVSGYVGQ